MHLSTAFIIGQALLSNKSLLDFLAKLCFHAEMSEKTQALQRAINAVGGLDGIARPLGITPQAVSQWDEVPPMRVLAVERITGIPREELRPDLYPLDRQPKVMP